MNLKINHADIDEKRNSRKVVGTREFNGSLRICWWSVNRSRVRIVWVMRRMDCQM